MPTDVSFLIEELEAKGVTFTLGEGQVSIKTPDMSLLPPDVIATLREQKPQALAYLNKRFVSFSVFQGHMDCKTEKLDSMISAALRESCRNYPAGMIAWLEAVHPRLYHQIVTVPLDTWTENVNVSEFDKVLGAWVACHRAACELYLASKDTSSL
jgi:hypothetical protein